MLFDPSTNLRKIEQEYDIRHNDGRQKICRAF